MEVSSVLLLCFYLSLLFQMSHCTTVVVDGVSEWKNPTVQIGDYIIFNHKNDEYKYKVYIFRNEKAFELCNFTQSTLLSNPNSTSSSSFTWHPSRPGYFYFSFNNDSIKACQQGQKLSIKVSSPSFSPPENQEQPPIAAPLPPSSGGIVSSSPAYSWPSLPQELNPPSPAPTAVTPATSPTVLPERSGGSGGGGMPFISSNPAVPLPMGEVDSATISPHTSAHHRLQVVGFLQVERAVWLVLFIMQLL